jgi:hypothetical protein
MPAGISTPTTQEILAAQQPGQLESFISQQAGGAQFVDPNVTGVALTPEQINANQAYICTSGHDIVKPPHKHKLALLQGLAHQILDLHIAT